MDVTLFGWVGLVDTLQNACDVAGFLLPRIPSSRSVFPTTHAIEVFTTRTHTLGRYALATCPAHVVSAVDDRYVDLDHPGYLFLQRRRRDRGRSPARAEE